jgi:DNA replication protein DnaC
MANRHEDLTRLLRALQLHYTAAGVDELALRAAKEGLTHAAFLYELVRQEVAYREQRRFERLVRASRLPREKTFAQLDLSPFGPLLNQQLERLREGTFVQQAVNVIAVGKPGTGKSHVTAAVGHVLVAHGHPGAFSYWRRPAGAYTGFSAQRLAPTEEGPDVKGAKRRR